MQGAAVAVAGLRHRFRSSSPERASKELVVLDGVDLQVPAGGYAAVTGASGAGKSTLLSLLGGLESPQQGAVQVDGIDLHRLSRNRLADYRRETVGFVFQHFGLLDTLTAAENVELASLLAGRRPSVARTRARELLGSVGLGARTEHRPSRLSGGERQRVAIARALVNEPRLLLADEPTGNLDDDSTEWVIAMLESLSRDEGCTLLLVTHDRRLAARADHRYELADGSLHEVARA